MIILNKKSWKAIRFVLATIILGSLFINCGSGSPPINIPTPVSHMAVSSPDSDGNVRVTGLATAADPGTTVTITNVTTGATTSVSTTSLKSLSLNNKATANADGSFQDTIPGSIGDVIQIDRTSNTIDTTDRIDVPGNIPQLPLAATSLEDLVYNPNTEEVIIIGNDGTDGFLYFLNINTLTVTTATLTGLSGANRISLNIPSQIIAIIDADNLSDVSHYHIGSATLINDPVAGGVGAADVSASTAAGSAVLANLGASPSLSFYNLATDTVTGMGDITSGAATQASAIWINIDSDGVDDIAAVVSLMSDTTYLLSTNRITPGVPTSTQLTGDVLDGMSTPGSLAFFSTANEVLITDRDNDRTFHVIISTATFTTIAVGDDPRGVAVKSSDDIAYVVNNADRNLFVIDIATETITSTVDLGLSPTLVTTDRSGGITTVIVLNAGDNTLTLIN